MAPAGLQVHFLLEALQSWRLAVLLKLYQLTSTFPAIQSPPQILWFPQMCENATTAVMVIILAVRLAIQRGGRAGIAPCTALRGVGQ